MTVSLTTLFFLAKGSLSALAMMSSQRCDSRMTLSGDIRRVPRRARALAAALRLRRAAMRFSGRLAGAASAARGAARRAAATADGSPFRAPLPAGFPAAARRTLDSTTTPPSPAALALASRFSVFFI